MSTEFIQEYNGYLFFCGHSNSDSETITFVSIVSESHWDRKHCVSDYHLTRELFNLCYLPDFLEEVCESLFESSLSLPETTYEMVKLGFRMTDEFSEFSETHDPFIPFV